MRFKNNPQLPGAGRTRAWHHHGSDTPASPRAIYVHTKISKRRTILHTTVVFIQKVLLHSSYPQTDETNHFPELKFFN